MAAVISRRHRHYGELWNGRFWVPSSSGKFKSVKSKTGTSSIPMSWDFVTLVRYAHIWTRIFVEQPYMLGIPVTWGPKTWPPFNTHRGMITDCSSNQWMNERLWLWVRACHTSMNPNDNKIKCRHRPSVITWPNEFVIICPSMTTMAGLMSMINIMKLKPHAKYINKTTWSHDNQPW